MSSNKLQMHPMDVWYIDRCCRWLSLSMLLLWLSFILPPKTTTSCFVCIQTDVCALVLGLHTNLIQKQMICTCARRMWNCIQNPGYMKENFVICIESFHVGDVGNQNNVSAIVFWCGMHNYMFACSELYPFYLLP